MMEIEDPVTLLKTEFERRKSNNPAYSLRKYAQSLNIEVSFLSRVLKRKRSLSLAKALQLQTKIKTQKELNLEYSMTPVSSTDFEPISEWYSYAILELTRVKGFKWNSIWIARRLGVEPNKIASTMQTLVDLGIVTQKKGTTKIDTPNLSNARERATTQAMRRHQKQILLGAIDALDNVAVQNRDQTSLTLAFPSSRTQEMSDLLTQFRRTVLQKVKSWDEFDSVYQLSLSFYPVTMPQKSPLKR